MSDARQTIANLTRRLASELEQLASNGCWCSTRTDRCVNPGCRWRRELIAEARAALAEAEAEVCS